MSDNNTDFKSRGHSKPIKGPDGKEYPSISAMCRAYGVTYQSYTRRKTSGHTISQALGIEKLPDKNSHPITAPDGTKYPSVAAMCRVYGIQPSTLSRRLGEGWSLYDALTVEPYRKRVYVGKGGTAYSTKGEMYSALGLSRSAYHERIKRGWTEEEALTIPVGGRRKRVKAPDGRMFTSVKEMCEAYGANYKVYTYRVKKGVPPEVALSAQARYISKEVGGKRYETVKKMCDAYGITTSAFYGRLARGMKPEEALRSGMRRSPGSPGKQVIAPNGVKYDTIGEMCGAYGISIHVYESRKRMGWSLEKRLTKPVRHYKEERKGLDRK